MKTSEQIEIVLEGVPDTNYLELADILLKNCGECEMWSVEFGPIEPHQFHESLRSLLDSGRSEFVFARCRRIVVGGVKIDNPLF